METYLESLRWAINKVIYDVEPIFFLNEALVFASIYLMEEINVSYFKGFY